MERFDIKVHSYCLMTTHYHILIETPHGNLSQAIKWINVSYSVYFNRKRRRVGHLFQGRFKGVLVDADEYLKHLSRYIHLNPVRARMVADCKDYQWSSYPVFGGYAKSPEWLETGWLLSLFGADRDTAKKGNIPRDLAIYLRREMTGETGVALGQHFGGISGAGIVYKYNQVAKQIKTDRKLKGQVNQLRKRILNT